MNTAQIEAEIIDLHDELDELEESCDYLEYTLNRALEISDKIKRLGTENIRTARAFFCAVTRTGSTTQGFLSLSSIRVKPRPSGRGD